MDGLHQGPHPCKTQCDAVSPDGPSHSYNPTVLIISTSFGAGSSVFLAGSNYTHMRRPGNFILALSVPGHQQNLAEKGVSRSFIWNGGFECWCHVKGEDILERGLVPKERWMGQAEEPRLFCRGTQASAGGVVDIQDWGVNHHVISYSVPRVCRPLSYPTAPEQEAALYLHVRSEGAGSKGSSKAWSSSPRRHPLGSHGSHGLRSLSRGEASLLGSWAKVKLRNRGGGCL